MSLHKTRIDLPARTRTAVCKVLNERLSDLIDLKLQTKQAHWNVKGPSFIALHELFDEIAAVLEPLIDVTAERITTLGGVAEGTVPVIAKRSSLPNYPLNISAGLDHVDTLATSFAVAAKATRKSIDEADELGDADTADLFTGASRELDKQLWFLEAHLQADR
jgi:starvation-inducible DNA-binding protein